jgi:hypothetical protein
LLIELGRIDFSQDWSVFTRSPMFTRRRFQKERLLLAPPDDQNLSVRIPQRLD